MSDSNSSFKKLNSKENEELPYRFSYVIENIPQIVVITDFRGTIKYVNSRFSQQTGYTFEEVKGKNIGILKSGKTPSSTYKELLEIIRNGETWRGEFLNRKKNGEYYWELASISPIKSPRGIITHFFKVAEDITNLKRGRRIETAIRENKEKYQTIHWDIEEGYFEVDIAGNFTFFNDALCSILGYSKDELLGMNNRQYMDEKTAKNVYQTFNTVYRTGKPIKAFDWELIRKDRTRRFVEISVSLITNPAGERTGFRGIVRDITTRKQVEMALKESEEKYRQLVENSLQGIVIFQDGRIVFANKSLCEISGYSLEELLAMSPEEVQASIHPEDRARVFGNMQARMEGKPIPSRYEFRAIRKNGTVYWIEVYSTIIDYQERPAIQATQIDITERKQAEEELQKASEEVEKLNESLKIINSILRHDLLNDLTVIQGYLELQSINKNEDTIEEVFKITNKSVDLITRMGELEYLVFSNEPLRPYNLRQTIEEIVKTYSTSNVEFNVEGNSTILADHALTSIINNLIQNALIHADTERIVIKIIEQKEFCELRVTDYGVGIPDIIKSEIFKPGFKYGKTGNTGLGLYIVKKVIERYGGAIWVENNTPRGTTFVLRLNK